MCKTFKHIFPKMFRNNCICVPHGVSAHITMESKERKAIQCPRPGQLTRDDLLVQDNASLHTAHTTIALLYNRYWEHVPVQPQVSTLGLSSNWKIAENSLGSAISIWQHHQRWDPEADSRAGSENLITCSCKCLNKPDDFVDKQRTGAHTQPCVLTPMA
jgi:hypothetical protein